MSLACDRQSIHICSMYKAIKEGLCHANEIVFHPKVNVFLDNCPGFSVENGVNWGQESEQEGDDAQ